MADGQVEETRDDASRSTSAVPPLPPERRTPYEMLRQAIVDGTLPPGRPLVEVTLAKWCGVSRTPVREALLKLERDGLTYRTDRGLVVRGRSPEEILDIYDTRLILEPAAAAMAANRHSSHDLRSILWALRRGLSVDVSSADDAVDANQAFHSAVWKASHNESMVDLLERLALHLARYPGTTLTWPGRWEVAQQEHQAIASAIEHKDADTAHRLTLAHFTAARDIRLKLFEQESQRR